MWICFAYFPPAPGARAAGMKKRGNEVTRDIAKNTEETRKRKAVDLGGSDNGDVVRSPVKRQRGRTRAQDIVSMSVSPKRKSRTLRKKDRMSTNRYGKKGRTSSPAPSAFPAIDYDELPDLAAPSKDEILLASNKRRPAKKSIRKAAKVLVGMGKTRTSAMQREDEKLEYPTVKANKEVPKARGKRTKKADKAKATRVKACDHEEQHIIELEISEQKNVSMLFAYNDDISTISKEKKEPRSTSTNAVQAEGIETQTSGKEDATGSIKVSRL